MGAIQPDDKFGSGTGDAVVLQGLTRQLSWNAEMDGSAGTCKTGAGSAPDTDGWESDVHTAESCSIAESHGSRRPAPGQVSITFQEGTVLTLQECSPEGIVSLLETYALRRSALEGTCPC